jgi:membrane protease YdiL (CAAX protease family)
LLRQLGVVGPKWARQVLIGLSIGLALGFHQWVILASLPGFKPPTLPSAAAIVWLVAVTAGLRAPGEELALRGVLYRLLAPQGAWRRLDLWLRIVVFNLPLYLAPMVGHPDPARWLLGVAYGVGFSVAAVALRINTGSAIAPLAANIVFNTMFALASLI